MTAQKVIAQRIEKLRPQLENYPGLWEMFRQCFMNTVETTVQQDGEDTFVITGDIPAMWLRDSTAQVMHYMRFADDPAVAGMIEGLIARQAKCILRDPYANAFNKEPSSYKPFEDTPEASDWVWERKYEIDSLCYPLWLAEKYMAKTGSKSFLTGDFAAALRSVVDVLKAEQHHENSPYRFSRKDSPTLDTLGNDGKGGPVGYTGMTWSGFRPSDDVCQYGYLVPSNLFALRAMQAAQELALALGDEALEEDARKLAGDIAAGVARHGLVNHPKHGLIYAYEVDGLGGVNLMDDANVPSLLSLPYLEVCGLFDSLYQRTRAFVLSEDNPYYAKGSYAKGVGSPHTPEGYVWHIALCMQAMTSVDDDEAAEILNSLMATNAGTGFMHESFDPNDPAQFTRSWFAWANSLFGEFIHRLYDSERIDDVLRIANAKRTQG